MKVRKDLSADGLYAIARKAFGEIKDKRVDRNVVYPLDEVLSAGLSVFAFKFPSLLKYVETMNDGRYNQNLKNLFCLKSIPGETQFRDILDTVDPESLRSAYDGILSAVQRGNELSRFMVLDHYAIALDGTGFYSSSSIRCKHCLVKKVSRKKEEKSMHSEEEECLYHHQMLGASIVHPHRKEVIPLFPEAIMNEDGAKKNDCERNAAKRMIEKFRRHHPKMPVLILEDSLASNKPHLEMLKSHNCRYLVGAKEGDHKPLFEQFRVNSGAGCTERYEKTTLSGIKIKKSMTRTYEFIHGLDLNGTGYKTNFIYFTEAHYHIDKDGKKHESEMTFTWVTDLELTKKNIVLVVATARRRWAIENENFQTLKKSTDYNLEHNYGHGKAYLAINFAILCILSFLIDQVQAIACETFKAITAKVGALRNLWEKMRSAIEWNDITDWRHFLAVIYKRVNTT